MRISTAFSVLSLFASSAIAAPILGSTGALLGSGKAVTNAGAVTHLNGFLGADVVTKGFVKGQAELKVFIDLLVAVASGARYHSFADANLVADLAAKLKFDAFAKWTNDICVASYHHDAVCTELSGYIAASYYAYITGSAGADLFAAIGSARVNRWHTVLDGICSAPDAHHQSCDGVYATFDAWVKAAAKVDIVAVTTTRAKLNTFNLFATLDAYAKTTISGHASANVDAHANSHASRGLDLLGSGKVLAKVQTAAKSVTHLDIGKNGLRLGSITGVAADGVLLVDGLLLTDILAKFGAVLDNKTFLTLDKGALYLFSSTTAAVDGFTGVKLDKRILGEIAAGAKAKIDAVVAGTLDKHGLRLGAITGIATNGVLLVDGKLLTEVLAVAGIKLDNVNKGFLDIGKDGLYFFSSSDTAASTGGAGHIQLRGLPTHFAPPAPVAKVASDLKTGFDSTGKLIVDKDGFFLGTITGTAADGSLLVEGVHLAELLASYGLDLNNGNYVKLGKGGLYFFSGTSASAHADGKVHVREIEERFVGDLKAEQVVDGAASAVVGPVTGHGHGVKPHGIRLDVVADVLTKLGVKL